MNRPYATLAAILVLSFFGIALSSHLLNLPGGGLLGIPLAGYGVAYFSIAFAFSLGLLFFRDERALSAFRTVSGIATLVSVALLFVRLFLGEERCGACLVLTGFSFGIFWLVMRFFPNPSHPASISWGSRDRAILTP